MRGPRSRRHEGDPVNVVRYGQSIAPKGHQHYDLSSLEHCQLHHTSCLNR